MLRKQIILIGYNIYNKQQGKEWIKAPKKRKKEKKERKKDGHVMTLK